MLREIAAYFGTNSDSFFVSVREHIVISAVSLVIAAIIGVAGGGLCIRFGGARRGTLAVFQTLRVVPSLAVLLLLIPIMGIGTGPAVVALVLLAIPPILLNTIAGLDGVPEFMLETATAMGMTRWQIWRKVRFPLALPMILTGAKIAAIEIVASATLAAKIGAGGLGEIIFTGLGLNRTDLLLVGGGAVAVLSLAGGAAVVLLGKILCRHG